MDAIVKKNGSGSGGGHGDAGSGNPKCQFVAKPTTPSYLGAVANKKVQE